MVATLAILAAAGVNIIGLKTSAVVQKGMVALLLISLGVYIIFGLPRVSWEMLTPTIDNLMPNGFLSFLQGATMLSFACGGAKFLAENGGEVENPGKTIPRAMVVSTLIVAVFYALVGVVAAGVLPLDQVAGQNISVVAKDVFPAPVYLFFVIGGAWFALLTTLNGTLSWVTRGLQRASFDGWLPKSWGKETKSGAPIYLLGFFVVVGLIPVLTGMDTTDIANMGTGCSKLSDLLMVYACFRLPDVLPEVYEKSTLKMAPGKLKAVMVLVFLVLGGTSAVSLSSLTGGQFLGMGVFIVIAIIVMLLRQKHFKDADNFKANSKA